jgi:hypothetical protein
MSIVKPGNKREQNHAMNKSIFRFSFLVLLAIAMAGTPVALRAQNAATNAAAHKRIKSVTPFRGKLKAIDNTAKTISVGNEMIQITSETMITKAGKPATLEDGVVGDDVAGACRKDAEGKVNAVSLRFGPKVPAAANTKTNAP